MQYNKIAGGFASFPPPMIQGLSSAQQPQMVAPVAPGGAAPANALGGLAPGQSMPQPQTAAQQMPAQTMGVGGFGEPFGAAPAAPAPRLSGGDAWPPASPADMARYQQMFQRHDTDGDGKLSGGEIVPLLMALDPPKALLKDIWALADADADGALNQSEFCVAVYLTERAKEGRKPPATLPPGPFPPVAQAAPPAPAPAPAPAAHSRMASLSEDLFTGGGGATEPAVGTTMGGGGFGGAGNMSGGMGFMGTMAAPSGASSMGGPLGGMGGGAAGGMGGGAAGGMGGGAAGGMGGGVAGGMGGGMPSSMPGGMPGGGMPGGGMPGGGMPGGMPSGMPGGMGGVGGPQPANMGFGGEGGAGMMPAPSPAPPAQAPPAENEYAFRGPDVGFNLAAAEPSPEIARLQTAQTDAAAADKELWEKERATAQAAATTANLTQKLQDMVLFQRRCEASLADAADRAERAEREAKELRGRVDAVTASVEQATSTLEASTSRAATAEQESRQLAVRLQELQAEQMSLANGGGVNADQIREAELQSMRAQVAEAEAALGPHRQRAQLAAQQRMQLEMKLSELRAAATRAAADANGSHIAQLERDVQAAASGLASGGEGAERVALPAAIQRVAAAHENILRRAAQLGVQPPPPPPFLASALGVGGGGANAGEMPTWGDWKALEEEGFDTVELSWGGWASDKPAARPPPPPRAETPSSPSSPGALFGGAGITGTSVASSAAAFEPFGAGTTGATSAYGGGATGATSVGAGITGGSVASPPMPAGGTQGASFTAAGDAGAFFGGLAANTFTPNAAPSVAPPPAPAPAPAPAPPPPAPAPPKPRPANLAPSPWDNL